MNEVVLAEDLPEGFDGLAPCSMCGATGVCQHLHGVYYNGQVRPVAFRFTKTRGDAQQVAAEMLVAIYHARLRAGSIPSAGLEPGSPTRPGSFPAEGVDRREVEVVP